MKQVVKAALFALVLVFGALPRVSSEGSLRQTIEARNDTHRELLIFGLLEEDSVTIDSPLDGGVVPGTEDSVDVVVSYGSQSFLGFLFGGFSAIEVLLDNVIIAEHTSFLPFLVGPTTFNVNLQNEDFGEHSLKARGYAGFRFFGNAQESETVFFTKDEAPEDATEPPADPPEPPADPTDPPADPTEPPADPTEPPADPTDPPTDPPVPPPTDPPEPPLSPRCAIEEAFLLFTGQSETTSVNMGEINVTWTPAFAFAIEDDEDFLWCGQYTYDVFVAEGDFDFSAENSTIPELISLADEEDFLEHFETAALNMQIPDLEPGATYSVLVTAKTPLGLHSYNRAHALVEVATVSPILKDGFTRHRHFSRCAPG